MPVSKPVDVFESAVPWGIELSRVWRIGQFGRRRLERNGSFQDQRAGSSTEYLDQRVFSQGDSVRHINWRVFGRTDQLMVKLFHHEAAPKLDLVLDVSKSMTWIAEKWELAAKLWALFGALGDKAGSQVSGYLLSGEDLQQTRWQEPQKAFEAIETDGTGLGALRRVPWQNQSLRVIISDLLFPGSPAGPLDLAARGSESTAWLVPECPQEADPGCEGNVEFEACEGGKLATH